MKKVIPVLVSRSVGGKFRREMHVEEGKCLGIIRLYDGDDLPGGENSGWNVVTLSATDLVKVCVLGLRVMTHAHNGMDGYNVYIETDDAPNDLTNQMAELMHNAKKNNIQVDLNDVFTAFNMRQ